MELILNMLMGVGLVFIVLFTFAAFVGFKNKK